MGTFTTHMRWTQLPCLLVQGFPVIRFAMTSGVEWHQSTHSWGKAPLSRREIAHRNKPPQYQGQASPPQRPLFKYLGSFEHITISCSLLQIIHNCDISNATILGAHELSLLEPNQSCYLPNENCTRDVCQRERGRRRVSAESRELERVSEIYCELLGRSVLSHCTTIHLVFHLFGRILVVLGRASPHLCCPSARKRSTKEGTVGIEVVLEYVETVICQPE